MSQFGAFNEHGSGDCGWRPNGRLGRGPELPDNEIEHLNFGQVNRRIILTKSSHQVASSLRREICAETFLHGLVKIDDTLQTVGHIT
jgi:hypothetical protein